MADHVESKPVKDTLPADGNKSGKQRAPESHDDDDDNLGDDKAAASSSGAGASVVAGSAADDTGKKKTSKSNKIKQVLSLKKHSDTGGHGLQGLTKEQLDDFMKLNPALANELSSGSGDGGDGDGDGGVSSSGGATKEDMQAMLKKLRLHDMLTGLATSGKNRKDLASYKFWNTQPVPQFTDDTQGAFDEGPLKRQTVDEIPSEPIPLVLDQFRWETMDLMEDGQMEEVYKLLNGHYVEDDEAMFRFKYSTSILRWALMSPGWKKEWHVGIRSGKALCAFISAVPADIRIRDKVVKGSEVNFLCVHKKLRNKRLAPVLIKEITRRCNREGVFQAIYTGGIVLPKPVSTCRYFHRALDWQKLYDIGFSPLPQNSTPKLQVKKYGLPQVTTTPGLREMQEADIDAVYDLLMRYLQRYDLAPVFSRDEVKHWLLHPTGTTADRVVFSYVVVDASNKMTDFISYYCLESSVINHAKHDVIRAAYMYYYATETVWQKPNDKGALQKRLNELVHDALILAKKNRFDVFNGLSLMDNALFLEEQKFGPGDGQLHFYLFNYRAHPIPGGVDKKNQLDKETLSGVGFAML